MPFAEHFMLQGTFTVPASLPGSVNLNLGFIPTKFEAINRTELGANGSAFIQRIVWNNDFSTTNAMIEWITSGSTTMNVSNVTSNGITPYLGSAFAQTGILNASLGFGPAITGTTITKANPAVATATGHGLQTGDQVIFTNNVVMKQLGGLIFTVTVTGANTFTIPVNTNTANFTAETGFTIKKVIIGPQYQQQRYTISNITAANPAVVTTTTNHNLTVGQQVRIRLGNANNATQWGMSQINNLQAIISAVTATTITLGGLIAINSSAFTAWSWPTAANILVTQPAFVEPVGAGPTPTTIGNITFNQDLLDDAQINNQFQGLIIGTGILQNTASFVVAASDVFSYTAWRGDV